MLVPGLTTAVRKSNEADRWGIKAEKLEEFNSMIESVTIEPR